MTYVDFYKSDLADYTQKWTTYYGKFKFGSTEGMDILALRRELAKRKQHLEALKKTQPGRPNIDVEGNVEETFQPQIRAHQRSLQQLQQDLTAKKQGADTAHQAKIDGAVAASNASVDKLSTLYDELCTYRDSLSAAILRYNIKPSDMSIDLDSMTREEMEALVASCIESCKYITNSKSRNFLKLLYEAPKDLTDNDERGYYILAVAVAFLLAAPVILCGMFGYMFYNTGRIFKHVDGLRIADTLMYGINFDKYKDDPHLDEIGDVDYSELEDAYNQSVAALEEKDPAKAMEAAMNDIKANWNKVSADIEGAYRNIYQLWTSTVNALDADVAALQKQVDDYMSKLKPFGSECNMSAVMDTNYILGKAEGVIDMKYDVGLTNIIFAQRTPEMIEFARHMLANMLLSVRPKNLIIDIYDPQRLGQDFATFLDDSTKDHVKVTTDNWSNVLKAAREYSTTNLRILDQRSINEFNAEAESKGMVTLDYQLYLIATPDENLYKDKVFMEFLRNSARSGVIFWMFGETPVENCKFYKQPWEGVQFPYPTNSTVCNTAVTTYVNAYNTLKDSGIDYFKAFADKYIPRSKWWSENTDKGIKINIGLEGGDPAKGYALELGDANVHGLCVGATGAGKSVFNNQMIASLITRYPPSTLELILIDFKNIEFVNLTNKQTHYSRIPHARIVAGTKDGEYAISVFDYLMEEMERRTKLFSTADAKKLEDFNKKMRADGREKECVPRVLLIIDEFQVMFTEVEPKAVTIIQDRIRSLAKLARFCGCHMLFTSQSMAGTMSQDIKDQFSLRIALRCAADTSTSIIGSPAASKVKSKFGYCYSNTNAGQTQDSTKMWRTPFMPDEDFYDTIGRQKKIAAGKMPAGSKCVLDEIADMLAQRPDERDRHAYFYDEDEKYPYTVFNAWQQKNKAIVEANSRLFVLGERTGFSLKNSPNHFIMKPADGENLIMYAFESIDMQNLIMTMRDNIAADPTATLLCNCADPDAFHVLELDRWYNPDFLEQARPMTDPADWLDMLDEIIWDRKENGLNGRGPLYFMAIRWDKQNGIYRNENYKTQGRWESLLMEGPSVDVHFIMCTQLYKEVPAKHVGMFNHVISALGPDDASIKFLGNSKASKLPKDLGFGIYRYGQDEQKFKIYQYEFTRKAAARELAM